MNEPREFLPLSIAVLTVSDTRTFETDKSGDLLVGRLEDAGHELAPSDLADATAWLAPLTDEPTATGALEL